MVPIRIAVLVSENKVPVVKPTPFVIKESKNNIKVYYTKTLLLSSMK